MSGTLELFDHEVPIHGGDYTLTVTQTADAIATSIPPATQPITFVAPQVALDPAEVVQCSPAPSATGPFAEVLPSVLLAEPALPWERAMPTDDTPWLALLVFAAGELTGGDNPSTHASSTTAGQFLKLTGALVPPIQLESDVDPAQSVTYISVPTALFTAIAPRADELPWLAHVRRSIPDGGGDPTDVAVVFANRLPAPPAAGAPPATAVAHLVSVEGLAPWLVDAPVFTASGKDDGTTVFDTVALLSLASWTFAVIGDPAESFQGLTLDLQDAEYDPATSTHAPGNLALRLPPAPGYPTDPSDPGQVEVAARIADGYVPLTYHARSGEEAPAWFRGPITPSLIASMDLGPTIDTADDVLIYDAAHGIFDVSLAAAWQMGRAAALSDRAFGQALYAYRQAVQQATDALADRLNRPQFADQPAASLGSDALTEPVSQTVKQLLDRFRDGTDGGGDSDGSGSGETTPTVREAVEEISAALADQQVQDALAELVQDAIVPVAQWLASLTLLEPLPFTCLVPDPRMLPRATPAADGTGTLLSGAIRFGYVDPNWTAALVGGALSLAVESSRTLQATGAQATVLADAIRDALEQRFDLDEPPATPTTALLLRSDLVSGWPTLAVTPLDATGAPLTVLRMDRLASGVLLALFAGVPATVRIAEPHMALTLGVDEEGAAELRNLIAPQKSGDPAIGEALNATVGLLSTPTCLRGDGTGRVLAFNVKGGVVPTLTAALTARGQPTDAFGPAALALQLVHAPQSMLFTSSTGGS